MRQVVLDEPGRFSMREVPDPVPREDEVLVRVRRIGVCGTDLHAFGGRQPFFSYPRVLGHELAVTVEWVPPELRSATGLPSGTAAPGKGSPRPDSRRAGSSGPGGPGSGSPSPGAPGPAGLGQAHAGLRVGDVCAVRPFLNNPASRATRRGRPNCCEDLRVLGVHIDGGMGDRLAIAPAFLHPVTGVDLDVLALVEPLSIGCHAVARAALTPNDDVLVIGAGPIGLAVLQFAMLDAGQVTAVDLAPTRLALVEALFGAEGVRVSTTVPDDTRFDVVFDATGSAASMMRAFDYVAAGGRLVFVGLTLDPIGLSDPDFHRREITLLASRNATPDDFTRVLAAIRSGAARPDAWITHRLPLDDVPAGFARVKSDPTLIKAMIDVG